MKKHHLFGLIIAMALTWTYVGCTKDDEPAQFSLVVTVDPQGSGVVTPSAGTFSDGEVVALLAAAAQGFEFEGWGGDASGFANPLTWTMTADTQITAIFAPLEGDGDPLDSDLDGVADDMDQCPDTPAGEDVDENGCSLNQHDLDGDGVADNVDRCPDSPAGSAVDEHGCPVGSEYTFVPDDDFEYILIDQGFDKIMDDFVLTNSIENVTELYLPNFVDLDREYAIKDFTGIEDFGALEMLTILFADITAENLDLSQNTNLSQLIIMCSTIDGLDLSATTVETLRITGNLFFETCENSVSGLDLSGATYLRSLSLFHTKFDDLNATLKSATAVEHLEIASPQTATGPLEYLDLSANNNLTQLSVHATTSVGPSVINLKNGANWLIAEINLIISPLSTDPEVFNWEPCIEADDPIYIENIIPVTNVTPNFTVTTDCSV